MTSRRNRIAKSWKILSKLVDDLVSKTDKPIQSEKSYNATWTTKLYNLRLITKDITVKFKFVNSNCTI